MRILYILLIALICAASAAAEPFVPEPLIVSGHPYPLLTSLEYDRKAEFPVTVSGGPASVVLSIFTRGKGGEISDIQNGYLGWHYVNEIDTCIYMSPAYQFDDGEHIIEWDGSTSDGKGLPYNSYELTYHLHAIHTETRKRIAPTDFAGPFEVVSWSIEDEAPQSEPYIQGSNSRWVLGNDPTASKLIETTFFSADWIQTGVPLHLQDRVYVTFIGSESSSRVVQRYSWMPNGIALHDTDWGDEIIEIGETDIVPGQLVGDNDYLYLFDGVVTESAFTHRLWIFDAVEGEILHEVYPDPWLYLSDIPDLPRNTAPLMAEFGSGLLHVTSFGCLAQTLDPQRYMETEIVTDLMRWLTMDASFLSPTGEDVAFTDMSIDQCGFQYLTNPNADIGSFALLARDGSPAGWFALPGDQGGVQMLDVVSNGSVWDGIYTDNSAASEPSDRGGVWYTPASTFTGSVWINPGDPLGTYEVRIATPNGGERYAPGMDVEISWAVKYQYQWKISVNVFDLFFSSDGGHTWEPIVTGLELSTYNWAVPAVESNSCLVRVTDHIWAKGGDSSDAFFTITTETGVADNPAPTVFSAGPASPNPFNPTAAIPVELPTLGRLTATVYSITGQQVALIADGEYPAGQHSLTWDADGCAAGVYLCVVEHADLRRVVRMTLVK